jgi:ABC-type proline/glycine betaine transport system ATPase subunit
VQSSTAAVLYCDGEQLPDIQPDEVGGGAQSRLGVAAATGHQLPVLPPEGFLLAVHVSDCRHADE